MTTSQRPRVLMVAPQPFFRVSGTPINVLMMIRALTESGYAVDLLTLPDGEDVDLPGLTIHRVPRLVPGGEVPVGFSPAKLVYNPALLLAAATRLVRRRYVAVHAIEEAALWAVPLARLFRVPPIADLDSDLHRQLREQGTRLARLLAAPAARLRRSALRRAAVIISVAPEMTAIARSEAPGVPVHEISDIPIEAAARRPDPDRLVALRRELGLEGRRPVVYTGNLDRRQGVEELIRAMPEVLARHADAQLLIVGGSPERIAALRRLAADLAAGARVTFTGLRPPDEMADYMGLAAVLVSPRLEPHATPLKIFSYMASGRPIVATALPTHTNVLGPDAAVLVAPDPAGLAAGIGRVLEHPEAAQALARQARRLVEERYTYAIFKRRLLAAVRTVNQPAPAADAAAAAVETTRHA